MGLKDTFLKKDTTEAKEPEDINPNQTDPQRIQWDNQTEFLLTCIGYSVGLGNVWRFPYLCYKSGGGAFLLPYLLMIFLIGMPLLFMEYGFGQYFGIGSLSIYKKVCPMFQGIGVGYTVLNALVCIYYNVIIALSIYYFVASFAKQLPWSICGQSWNTPTCREGFRAINETFLNTSEGYASSNFSFQTTMSSYHNGTSISVPFNFSTATSPSDEYFRLSVMGMSEEHSINNIGQIRWKLCLALLTAWILVVIFVSRGIKSTGKVAYFTATFPYVMLTVLVVRGVTLPGAGKGILYFIKPQFDKLLQPDVWFGAATQLFYSTNLAWGGMITMASYSSFRHNMYRDAVLINWVSFFTSIYAGFAVFSIIGYMAQESGKEVHEIIESGPGLAFIVYPRALSLMPIPQLWSVLFFFMLFLLGIGSQMVIVETILTALVDEFPRLALNVITRVLTALLVAIGFFLSGIPLTTQGGMYVLQLMDWYAAGFCVIVIAIFECAVISWIYGSHTDEPWIKKILKTDTKFSYNIKEMLENGLPHIWWRICWKFISPVLLIGILIFSFVDYQPAKYGEYRYPAWADFLGWTMSLASVLPIFIVAIYMLITAKGETWSKKLYNCTNVTDAPLPGIEQSTLDMKDYKVELNPDDDEKAVPFINNAGDSNMV